MGAERFFFLSFVLVLGKSANNFKGIMYEKMFKRKSKEDSGFVSFIYSVFKLK